MCVRIYTYSYAASLPNDRQRVVRVRQDRRHHLDRELRLQLRGRRLDRRGQPRVRQLVAEVAALHRWRAADVSGGTAHAQFLCSRGGAGARACCMCKLKSSIWNLISLRRFSFCTRSFLSVPRERFQYSPYLRVSERSDAMSFLISASSASRTTQCDSSVPTTLVRSIEAYSPFACDLPLVMRAIASALTSCLCAAQHLATQFFCYRSWRATSSTSRRARLRPERRRARRAVQNPCESRAAP